MILDHYSADGAHEGIDIKIDNKVVYSMFGNISETWSMFKIFEACYQAGLENKDVHILVEKIEGIQR